MWKQFSEMTAAEKVYLRIGLYMHGKFDRKTGKKYWLVD